MSSPGSKRNRFSRRLEAAYGKGFEDGKSASSLSRKAELACCGRPVNEGSPEGYTLECCGNFIRPADADPVTALGACAPDLLLYNLLMEAINEGVAKATDPEWTTKDFGKSPYYQAIHAALSAQAHASGAK